MLIGTLAAIRRYPVKSLRGEDLDEVEVALGGIPGDRAYALLAHDGARAGKTYRGKENDRLHLVRDARAGQALATERGVAVEVLGGEHFFDDAPISIIVDAWMSDLNAHLGYVAEWQRFRPNFFVRANGSAIPPEGDLVGEDLLLGDVRLRVRSPIERCVTVTYHPDGDPSDPRVLRFLAQERETLMGIYCDVVEPATAHLNDLLILAAS